MAMAEWARKEIEIVKESRKKNKTADDSFSLDGYVDMCYASALKAYETLIADDHSGMSYGITRNILIRLLNELPLSPVEDIPESWSCISDEEDDKKGIERYECIRRCSLTKEINKNGETSYYDRDMFTYYEVDDKDKTSFRAGYINRLIQKYFPITFPYMPPTYAYSVGIKRQTVGPVDILIVYAVKDKDGKIIMPTTTFVNIGHGYKEI